MDSGVSAEDAARQASALQHVDALVEELRAKIHDLRLRNRSGRSVEGSEYGCPEELDRSKDKECAVGYDHLRRFQVCRKRSPPRRQVPDGRAHLGTKASIREASRREDNLFILGKYRRNSSTLSAKEGPRPGGRGLCSLIGWFSVSACPCRAPP